MLRPWGQLVQQTGLVGPPSAPLRELALSLSLTQLSLVGVWHSSSWQGQVYSVGLGRGALQQRREGGRRSTAPLRDRRLQRGGLLQAADRVRQVWNGLQQLLLHSPCRARWQDLQASHCRSSTCDTCAMSDGV